VALSPDMTGVAGEAGSPGAAPESHTAALQAHRRPRGIEVAMLASVFVIAACGLVYELAAGALASYLLGDSVLQFSTVIGCYLFAMGVGSWLSRFLVRQLPAHFLRIELLVALVGGMLPAVLFVANAWLPGAFHLLLYGFVGTVGVLVGLEIPLVMRILRRDLVLSELVSQVLTFDYLGALAVSLAFPLLLVPHLGLVRTGLAFGLMNAAVGFWALYLFRHELRQRAAHAFACVTTIVVLCVGFAVADRITTLAEDKLYQEPVVFAASSPYQRIIVTEGKHGHRLFLNGNLQFAESDEYRYHEALVHPVMSAYAGSAANGPGSPRRVAVLGGGDGMAVREILKYPGVQSVTLVELDPNMTRLFTDNAALAKLNHHSLSSPKVHIVNTDAFGWLQGSDEAKNAEMKAGELGLDDLFDVIVVDFPDPTNFAIGKLYTRSFYALLGQRLAAGGYAVVQTTSPLIARQSFWTVVQTIESAGLIATPYHVNVPSFGEWGFVIASHRPWRLPQTLPAGLRFLDLQSLPLMFDFPLDMKRVPAEVNRLSNQVLVQSYAREWGR
jgi:spermidine synthase